MSPKMKNQASKKKTKVAKKARHYPVAGSGIKDQTDKQHPPKGPNERRRDHRGKSRRVVSGPKTNSSGAGGSGGFRRVRV